MIYIPTTKRCILADHIKKNRILLFVAPKKHTEPSRIDITGKWNENGIPYMTKLRYK